MMKKLLIGVFALSTIPIKSIKKNVGDVDINVSFMNVTFKPGDYIYADLDGIILSNKKLDIS